MTVPPRATLPAHVSAVGPMAITTRQSVYAAAYQWCVLKTVQTESTDLGGAGDEPSARRACDWQLVKSPISLEKIPVGARL